MIWPLEVGYRYNFPMTVKALRFGIDTGGHGRKPKENEFFYREELPGSREALILAQEITVQDGDLIAKTDGNITLALASGSWVSVYMCEAIMANDPWSILDLPIPVS